MTTQEFNSIAGLVIGDTVPGARASGAYSAASQAERGEITNPDWGHWQPDTLFDETNMTDGTYDIYVNMDTFRRLFLQAIIDGGSGSVTIKIYASAQFTDGDPSLLDYDDVTNDWFGTATITASDLLGDHLGLSSGCTWVHVEIVAATGGANDADCRVDSYRLF